MESFNELVSRGVANAWLYVPTAIVLGALHGLEPGHSKTMMAAFIVAVRGTVTQAVLLGLSAAFSHSLVIWVLAALALRFGSQYNAETTEPYFQAASGLIIIGLAAWMFFRTHRDGCAAYSHHHGHEGLHGGQLVEAGGYEIEVSVFETGVPPRFRLYFRKTDGSPIAPPLIQQVRLDTHRPWRKVQTFDFELRDGYLEATTELPEPHEFQAVLKLWQGKTITTCPLKFVEHHHHEGLDISDGKFQDAHEHTHAQEIARRFANRSVTTGQIIMFGLTGGLLPCPAAFTVLLVCLQLKAIILGFTLVLCFSTGLAATMVATGTAAALSVRYTSEKFAGFGEFARKAPCLSAVLLTALGSFMFIQGLRHLV